MKERRHLIQSLAQSDIYGRPRVEAKLAYNSSMMQRIVITFDASASPSIWTRCVQGSKDGMPIRDAATLVWCMGKMQLRIAELDRLFQVITFSLLLSQNVYVACIYMYPARHQEML